MEFVEISVQDNITMFEEPTAVNRLHVLGELKLGRQEREHLDTLSFLTYVPATEPWVRIGSPLASKADTGPSFVEYEQPDLCFIRRVHAQTLAIALMEMPWHPQGLPASRSVQQVECSEDVAPDLRENDSIPLSRQRKRAGISSGQWHQRCLPVSGR